MLLVTKRECESKVLLSKEIKEAKLISVRFSKKEMVRIFDFGVNNNISTRTILTYMR